MTVNSNKKETDPLDICPECRVGIILHSDRGESVCSHCGIVSEERRIVMNHSGVNVYTKEDSNKKSRNGDPIKQLLADISMITVIPKSNHPIIERLRKIDTQLQWKKENYQIALTELKRIGALLGIPLRIRESAFELYKKAYKKQLLRGREIKGMLIACLYYYCKKENRPITLSEIVEVSDVNSKNLLRFVKVLYKEFRLPMALTNPVSLIPRFSAELELPHDIESEIITLLQWYMRHNSPKGNDPKGYCAGAIYYVANKIHNMKKLTQFEISNVVGVTEVTLRSRYTDLAKSRGGLEQSIKELKTN